MIAIWQILILGLLGVFPSGESQGFRLLERSEEPISFAREWPNDLGTQVGYHDTQTLRIPEAVETSNNALGGEATFALPPILSFELPTEFLHRGQAFIDSYCGSAEGCRSPPSFGSLLLG